MLPQKSAPWGIYKPDPTNQIPPNGHKLFTCAAGAAIRGTGGNKQAPSPQVQFLPGIFTDSND